jgi:hypothetical protein
MLTLSIRYTLDPAKLADFAAYGRAIVAPARRCGAQSVAYYVPTKFAGPTNAGLALLDFPSLAVYEQYRERLAQDPEASEVHAQVARTGCILGEDRTFLQPAA